MASFQGELAVPVIYSGWPTNVGIGQLEIRDWRLGWVPSVTIGGALSNEQPVTEREAALDGDYAHQYGFLHWYNRIHLQYQRIALGNLVSRQQVPFWVFNAWFVPRNLTEIDVEGGEGLLLIQPEDPPTTFLPLEQRTYELEVELEGPSEIAARFEFVFADVPNPVLRVNGTRIIGWAWEPNWIEPVRERLSWLTDVTRRYDGSEQRRQLRQLPRQEWEFVFDVSDEIRRRMENTLYAWSGRAWALPVWPDIEALEAPLSAGAMSIPVATEGKQYQAGGLVMLISPDGSEHEATEVASIEPGSLELARELIRDWPVGTRIYPAVVARLIGGSTAARWSGAHAYGYAAFRSLGGVPGDEMEEPSYRDAPVLERVVEWLPDPQFGIVPKADEFDPLTGPAVFRLEDEAPDQPITWTWQNVSRAESDWLRAWLYARRGRCRGVWIPSYAEDLVLADTVGGTAENIDFEAAGLVQFVAAGPNRRDVRIELRDGTVFYRRLSGMQTTDEHTERATIDAPLGVTINPADVWRISWMAYCRLDVDSIEILWDTPAVSAARIAARAVRNDV